MVTITLKCCPPPQISMTIAFYQPGHLQKIKKKKKANRPLPLLGKRSSQQEFARTLTQRKRKAYFCLLTGSQGCSEQRRDSNVLLFLLLKSRAPFPQAPVSILGLLSSILRGMELEKRGWVRGSSAKKNISHGDWDMNIKNIRHFDSVHSISRDLSREILTEMPQVSYEEIHRSIACEDSKLETTKISWTEDRLNKQGYTMEYSAALKQQLMLLYYYLYSIVEVLHGLANVASTSWQGRVWSEPHKLQNKSVVFHFCKYNYIVIVYCWKINLEEYTPIHQQLKSLRAEIIQCCYLLNVIKSYFGAF